MPMNIQEIAQHIAESPARDLAVKASGLVGAGVSFFGVQLDLSGFSEIAQIAANVGIFLAGLAAFMTILYTVFTGRKRER